MTVTSPEPKPYPKCGGIMYWIINSQLAPGVALTSKNRHMVVMGYICRGKNDLGCGHSEIQESETHV